MAEGAQAHAAQRADECRAGQHGCLFTGEKAVERVLRGPQLLTPAFTLLLATSIGPADRAGAGWRHRQDEHEGGRIAGIRTFSLLGLGGALNGLAGWRYHPGSALSA